MSGPTLHRQLAAAGGTPIRRTPVPAWPVFGPDEIAATTEVLASGRANYWTGDQGRRFEAEFARWVEVEHAVAVSNGTVALELALRALGVQPGDEVIVPTATFIATASAVVAVGAVPVVVDVEPVSQCLTAELVSRAVTSRTSAVVVVHMAGWPVDVAAIRAVADRHGVRVLEDCAQAHGARIDGRPVGSLGHAAAWSFCQDKILTTAGEGGAVTTNAPDVWRACWERKDHGKSWVSVTEPDPRPGFRWLHDSFGTNARLTEVQAAVGRRQLTKVDDWVARRRRHATALIAGLGDIPALRLPAPPLHVEHAWYRFWVHVRPELLRPGWDRDRIVASVLAEGLPCAHGGCTEIHRERAFPAAWQPRSPTPVGAELGRTSFVLPVHPTLADDDVEDLVEAVRKILEVAGT
ncbi:DegT/DnrJ/EryC1/StrS aminotransferase family protein [Actinomycetospora sp. OC33-EN08]|uniref:DegT/DnrJ/EryC1/StrS aminotransferase family protein n=1 Tax=Actinomycetospora aurantiaca TaxID=3129233 RepID=A0ABU8MH25_9PSEU